MSSDTKFTVLCVPKCPASKSLYKMERELSEGIMDAARELLNLMAIPEDKFWEQALPSEIYTILLDGFERGAAEAAAKAFLENRGYVVSAPAPTQEISNAEAAALDTLHFYADIWHSDRAKENTVIKSLERKGLEREKAKAVIESMIRKGLLMRPTPAFLSDPKGMKYSSWEDQEAAKKLIEGGT